MSDMAARAVTGVTNPRLIPPYLRRQWSLIRTIQRLADHKSALLYLLDMIRDGERLFEYLETNDEVRLVECDLGEFQMRLDLLDEGLSRDLMVNGTREPLATARYREELLSLEADRGGLTVIDIGANLGYFAFQYAHRAPDDGQVIAIEPVPSNYELLLENVRLNELEDSVTCYQRAIGPEVKPVEMKLSTHRNLATVARCAGLSHFIDEITVDMVTLDDFLREIEIPYHAVDVLRMDLQGYEYEVFRGMPELLNSGDIGLIFIEIHPWALREMNTYDRFLELLDARGFEVAFVADGRTAILRDEKPSYAERELDIETVDGLLDIDHTVEVLLTR